MGTEEGEVGGLRAGQCIKVSPHSIKKPADSHVLQRPFSFRFISAFADQICSAREKNVLSRRVHFVIEVRGVHVLFCTQICQYPKFGTTDHVDTPDFHEEG